MQVLVDSRDYPKKTKRSKSEDPIPDAFSYAMGEPQGKTTASVASRPTVPPPRPERDYLETNITQSSRDSRSALSPQPRPFASIVPAPQRG